MDTLPPCLIKYMSQYLDLRSRINLKKTCKLYNKSIKIKKHEYLTVLNSIYRKLVHARNVQHQIDVQSLHTTDYCLRSPYDPIITCYLCNDKDIHSSNCYYIENDSPDWCSFDGKIHDETMVYLCNSCEHFGSYNSKCSRCGGAAIEQDDIYNEYGYIIKSRDPDITRYYCDGINNPDSHEYSYHSYTSRSCGLYFSKINKRGKTFIQIDY